MFPYRTQYLIKCHKMIIQNFSCAANEITTPQNSYCTSAGVPKHTELPRKLRRSERKPFVTHMNEIKRTERLEKQMRLCGEVNLGSLPHKIRTCYASGSLPSKGHSWVKGGVDHILSLVESFHMYDRIGRGVCHEEYLQVDWIPASLELCIQAGVDIPEYPTRRRSFPVYRIAEKMIDFEPKFPRQVTWGQDIQAFGFWEKRDNPRVNDSMTLDCNDLQGMATRGLDAWEKMWSGAITLMKKYAVQTCEYCPEVQVGPKGYRARLCQAHKHQLRDGQHAWQEATIDDLVPPVYVWHVKNPQDSCPLTHKLKRYFGKLPVAVELFAQAGAQVGDGYHGLMREDILVPEIDEEKLVV